jgi:undecaprenyl diphosphate synthase
MKRPDKELILKKIDKKKLPVHVAIIMDGNGRWAKQRNLPRAYGHKRGIDSVREMIEGCIEAGVKYLTLYAFSTENWSRPKTEINVLMKLLQHYLRKELADLQKNNVKLTTIGDINKLPEFALKELNKVKQVTGNNSKLIVALALNYGSRQEITDAVNTLIASGTQRVTEQQVSASLESNFLPDPDLLIRTSGEQRTSNFLLWQAAYAELYFTPVLWPDFDRIELFEAIIEYQSRERRFGGL